MCLDILKREVGTVRTCGGQRCGAAGTESIRQGSIIGGDVLKEIRMGTARVVVRQRSCDERCETSD